MLNTYAEANAIADDITNTDTIVVNHVMSNDVKSKIFEDFLEYFKIHSPPLFNHIVTVAPIEGANVYHYHRPNLEKQLRANAVVTVHHDLEDSDEWHHFSKFSAQYRQASRIVCLNSRQEKWLNARGYSQTRVVPHGVQPRFFKTQSTPPAAGEKITLGIASRRYARRVKGEALLMELAKRFSPYETRFVLVGASRSIDASALRALGFETEIFERLPYRLFTRFYESIDALLVLSWHEGGPACIPEAVASGVPIFTTRVGMANDLVVEGENGGFLERDPDSDAQKIMRFIRDADIQKRLFSGAISRTASARTWSSIISDYATIYTEVSSR